jgi:hypothetical protein
MLHARFARYADGTAGHGVEGNIPVTAAGYGDFRRKLVERAAMVGVAAAVLETAKVSIVHQANIAGLGALDNDEIILVEVFALVDEFHQVSERLFLQNQKDSMGWAFSSVRTTHYYADARVCCRFVASRVAGSNPVRQGAGRRKWSLPLQAPQRRLTGFDTQPEGTGPV